MHIKWVSVITFVNNDTEATSPMQEFAARTHQQASLRFRDPRSFWWHAWTPKAPGSYLIRLRVTDPVVETRRLDSGITFVLSR